jgi:hypothetical protein
VFGSGGDSSIGVTALLDGVGPEELAGLSAPELLERTRSLIALVNRAGTELARTVRAAGCSRAPEHDGLRTMRSWLRGHVRLSTAAAGQLVRAGRTLQALPAVAAAAAAGAVTLEQLTVIGPVGAPENLARAETRQIDLAAVDALLADVAATRPHAELARVVAHYLARLDPDGPEPDPTATRSCTISTHPDGRVTGRFDLDPAGGEKVRAAIESFTCADRPAGDLRTRAQQQADALVQWADATLATGQAPRWRGVRPHLAVKVDLEDLVDPATGPGAARLGFGAVLSAARARWAACDADLTRLVLDPDGLPLDVGRTVRLVPPWLRKAVEARDGGCVFTGCDAPSWWCEVHHLLHWALGGPTSLENSGLLCERHHLQIHTGYRIERQPDGSWRTWRPDGTEVLLPALLTDTPELARAG